MEMAAASGLERMAGAPWNRCAPAASARAAVTPRGGGGLHPGADGHRRQRHQRRRLGPADGAGRTLSRRGGQPLPPAAASLAQVAAVDVSGMIDLSDVAPSGGLRRVQPLCGPEGATAVYGPQKGVTPEQIPMLDAALAHYAGLLEAAWGDAFGDRPGAGAAGGLGFALYGLGARLERGSELVAQAVDLDGALREADLVITGEGATDGQTAYSKAVKGCPAGAGPGRPSGVSIRRAAAGLRGPLCRGGQRPVRHRRPPPIASSKSEEAGADPPGQRQPAAPVPGGPVKLEKSFVSA